VRPTHGDRRIATDDLTRMDLKDDAPPHEETRPSNWGRFAAWAMTLSPAWKGLAAFLAYQAVAVVRWVFPIASSFDRVHLGPDVQDGNFYQWALSWTPWALTHGQNPLHTGALFAPTGVDLAWTAFIPGPALVTWPVTAAFGPLASLNLILSVAPALAAWSAYLLCARLTRSFWTSFAAGFLFGFSPYMATNMNGYANLVLIFPVPLLVYLAVRRVEGSIGRAAFVAGFSALLVGLFSISTEVFGTTAVLGAVAFGGAVLIASSLRRRLLETAVLILVSGAIAAVALAPYVWSVVVHRPAVPVRSPELALGDVRAFVVPAPVTALGKQKIVAPITASPRGNGERYLGIGAIATVIGFAITERRRRETWALIAFLLIILAFALGPVVTAGGGSFGWFPGRLLGDAPLLSSVWPPRLTAYATLVIAVIAALWLVRGHGGSAWLRWAIVVIAIAGTFPGPITRHFPQTDLPLMTSPVVREVLRPAEVVYAIPFVKGDENRWQLSAGFWFRSAEGEIGPIPAALDSGPIAHGLHIRTHSYLPTPQEFRTWIQQREVTAVVLDDRAEPRYGDLLEETGLVRVYKGGGASVWRWPGD
jgi:hypothetical protein